MHTEQVIIFTPRICRSTLLSDNAVGVHGLSIALLQYKCTPALFRKCDALSNALNTPKASNLRRANRCALGVHRAIY